MTPLGPFEPAAHLAVGVSGGSDSLALLLLADRWVRQRGGSVMALTVDHRLRPQSAAEAGLVRSWLAARDIEHRVLTWREPHSVGGVQAAARAARLRLLGDWCRRKGVLHLMLAHQLEDQAETLLERLSGGSGVDGLAGMPQVRALGL
ncbi:MAG: tRNA lysidine(34) synthetase TilS, partial [Alphaproteobacteria bacterium]|nr:tRNA lysidine(34) synthetase TilS [Alphaproteobacteria bacterium]